MCIDDKNKSEITETAAPVAENEHSLPVGAGDPAESASTQPGPSSGESDGTGVDGKDHPDERLPQVETGTASPDGPVSESKQGAEGPTDGEMVEYSDGKLERWAYQIGSTWRRTVQGIIETGKLIADAKEDLGATYRELEKRLPFSASQTNNFVRIARNRVLSDPKYWDNLPKALNTLYYLARFDEARLLEYIGAGKITPELKVSEAKALAVRGTGSGPAAADKQQGGFIDVVISLPRDVDLEQALQEGTKYAQSLDGVVSYRKNVGSVGNEWKRVLAQKADLQIGLVVAQEKIPWLGDMRLVEAAAADLVKRRKGSDGDTGPCLPQDFPKLDELELVLGTRTVTEDVIVKWSEARNIPTRFTFKKICHPIYVWEQVRSLVDAEKPEEVLKRLDAMRHSKKLEIAEVAIKAIHMIENIVWLEGGGSSNT